MEGYKQAGMPQQAYSAGLEYRDPKILVDQCQCQLFVQQLFGCFTRVEIRRICQRFGSSQFSL